MATEKILELRAGPEAQNQIETLQRRLDLKDHVSVIRRALALLDMVSENKANGGKLFMELPTGEQEAIELQ